MDTKDSFREHPDLLSKVEDLNKKLDHLKEVNRKITLQHNILKEKGGRFSLDFIESSNLEEIEKGIRETIEGVVLSRAAVCKSLANIDSRRLYTQAGCNSFMEYLREERIPIKYKTAKEYAKIGDTLMRHADGLAQVDFREEDGLKKLIFLDKALKKHRDNPRQVYKKIKECSLRAFRSYASHAGDSVGVEPFIPENRQGAAMPDGFEIQNRSVYRSTSAGSRVTVLKVMDPDIETDNPAWKEYMYELVEITRRYFNRFG